MSRPFHHYLWSAAATLLILLQGSIWRISFASMMSMNTMLMAQTLEEFLSTLVSFGSISVTQKDDIIRMSMTSDPDFDPSIDAVRLYDHDVFPTAESKQALRSYLFTEVDADSMEYESAETIASILCLGALYPRNSSDLSNFGGNTPSVSMLSGPVGMSYTNEGNIVRLGSSSMFGIADVNDKVIYNGIWGYAVGSREYALQCHGNGLNILDVTDPSNIFRVQFVPMDGGGIWRDVATHFDINRNKTFAYVGGQGTHGNGKTPCLFVIDLSNLSGDEAHTIDENPALAVNLGETPKFVHTINVDRGLLFLNTANANEGCRVYDIVADPMNPRFLFKTGGSTGRDCHDSSVVTSVNSRDLLIVSDGSGRTQRIWDITDVDENWTTNDLPDIIGQTEPISGIYAHSNWVSENKRYLYCFDEQNTADIAIYDISDPTQPTMMRTFVYSGDNELDAAPHNGEIRGQYLYLAYYRAGLRVFDISNPLNPYEVGKTETFRDPNGDGIFENNNGGTGGAWNTYPFLPSGNILVNDLNYGLFVVKPTAPYARPRRFSLSSEVDQFGNTILSWTAANNTRGYEVLRSESASGSFIQIAEHLTETSFTDESQPFSINFYKVRAHNGVGMRPSFTVSSNGTTVRLSKAAKRNKYAEGINISS